jgi:hypothetical protein
MFTNKKNINRGKLLALFIIFLEAVILYFGVTLPLVRVKHLWVFKEEQSVIDILVIFYQHNELLLLILVSIMGLILPFLKLLFRAFELDGKVFKFISRFSSIDIFLIAILIFIGKSVSLIDVNLSAGFYFLCVGIIMGLLQVDKFLRPYFAEEDLSGN